MANIDLVETQDRLAGLGGVESTEVGEILRHPRVVVFGSASSGAMSLRSDLGQILKDRGFEVPIVFMSEWTSIESSFFNQEYGETLEVAKTRKDVPDQVVLFPEMRGHDATDAGFFVSTRDGGDRSIQAKLEKLCNEYGVPLWVIDKWPLDSVRQNARVETKNPGFLKRLGKLIRN